MGKKITELLQKGVLIKMFMSDSPKRAFFTPFRILILVIIMSGLSQGLLLPLLSIMMENQGVSASVNGLHAASLYVGSFLMSIIAERILGITGFKKLMLGGLVFVIFAMPLFLWVTDIRWWLVLRILVGIGDSAIHFASQLWMLMITPAEQRGRNISLYGMSYGLGFSIGPLGIRLLSFGQWVPFAVVIVLFVLSLLIVYCYMPEVYPERVGAKSEQHRRKRSYVQIYKLAWFALLPSLLYGYMEASMNANFPIYGLRIGFDSNQIATLLPFFGLGGLILQLPLGYLSDRYGRKPVLMLAGFGGGLLFLLVPFVGNSFISTLLLFIGAGGLIGSFFSLGLAYAADILPKHMLPIANVIASFHFSLGSIIGPNLSGLAMQTGNAGLLFTFLGSAYLIFTLSGLLFKRKRQETA